MQHTPAIEDLLERPDWIRNLAHSLVSDAATADDLIQDAWMSALQSPAAEIRDPQGWFARILRNRASQHWRTASRRENREHRAAKKESLPSTADLVARVSQQRDLIGNILALDTKYRDVLVLRYFEDYTSPEIASRLGIPQATAETRLQRAKASLRERLDTAYGDRSSWCVALMPLALSSKLAKGTGLATGATAGTSAGVHSFLSGVLSRIARLVSSPWFKLAVPATLVLGGFIALSDDSTGDSSDRPERRESLSPQSEIAGPSSKLAALTDEGLPRYAVGTSAEERPPEASTETPTVAYSGRLIGIDGSPIGNARIGWVTPETVHWLPNPGMPKLGNSLRQRPFPAKALRQIDRPAAQLYGLLTDVDRAEFPSWLAAFRDEAPMLAETRTAPNGSFTLQIPGPWEEDGAPIGNPRLILDGHLLHTVGWTPSHHGRRERVLLAVPTVDIAGQILDQHGDPLPDFRFRLDGDSSTIAGLPLVLSSEECSPWKKVWFRTDQEGRFDLKDVYSAKGITLSASSRSIGQRSEPVPLVANSGLIIRLAPFPVTGEAARFIHGVVIGTDGTPKAKAHVFHHSASAKSDENGHFRLQWKGGSGPFDVTVTLRGHSPRTTSIAAPNKAKGDRVQLMAGDPSHKIAGTLQDTQGRSLGGYQVSIFDPTYSLGDTMTGEERATLGAPQPVTNRAGKFEIFGLSDRTYQLLLWNPATKERLVTEPIQAGDTEVSLEHQVDQAHQIVTGRVVDAAGNGIVGAMVRGGFRAITDDETASVPIWQARKTYEAQAESETDRDGYFVLTDLPHAFELINVSGPSLEPQNIMLEPGLTEDLRIEATHLYGFRLKPESVASYRRLEAYDYEGNRVPIYTDASRESVMRPRREVTIHGGPFPFCEVPISASSLRLFANDGSTLDILLQPRAGAVDLLLP